MTWDSSEVQGIFYVNDTVAARATNGTADKAAISEALAAASRGHMAASLIRKADERFGHLPIVQLRVGYDCYDLQEANERIHRQPGEPMRARHGSLAPAPLSVDGKALRSPVLRRDEVKCDTPLTCGCAGRANSVVDENKCMKDTPLVAGHAFGDVYGVDPQLDRLRAAGAPVGGAAGFGWRLGVDRRWRHPPGGWRGEASARLLARQRLRGPSRVAGAA